MAANKSRQSKTIPIFNDSTINIGKKIKQCNNNVDLPMLRSMPNFIYGALGKVVPYYYIRNATINLINETMKNPTDDNKAKLSLLLTQDREMDLPLHPFIDKLIESNNFCLDCYYSIITEISPKYQYDDKYENFNKYFHSMDCIDPYTLLPIKKMNKKDVSIEHILPYSKTRMDIYLDADYQNLCYINTQINSIRNDRPLSFESKNPTETISVFYDNKNHTYEEFTKTKKGELLDDYPTIQTMTNKDGKKIKVFVPPYKSFGFIGRKILYCILAYLGTNCDNFSEMYEFIDFNKLLFALTNNFNITENNSFEFDLNDKINTLQGKNNICLTQNYFIVRKLFGRNNHTHNI